MHYEKIDEPQMQVTECLGYGTYGAKTQPLPERNRSMIGTDDRVELHGEKTRLASRFETVLTKASSNPASKTLGIHHVASVSYMCSESALVGLQCIRPNNHAVGLCHVDGYSASGPVFLRYWLGNIRFEGIGISARYH